MNAAPLSSPRLQRLIAVLGDGQEHSTRDIVRKARLMAVSTCVSELRTHGAEIDCTIRTVMGARRFFYRMTKGPETK
jgi:hypothetical protein